MPTLAQNILTLLSLTTAVSCRHIHHTPIHKHNNIRQADSTSRWTITAGAAAISNIANMPQTSSITAGNAAVADIINIQQGLSDLPGDLLDFVRVVEDRLGVLEDVLEDLVPATTTTTTGGWVSATTLATITRSSEGLDTSSSSSAVFTTASRTTSRSPFVPTSSADTSSEVTATTTRTTHVQTTLFTTLTAEGSSVPASTGFSYSANSTINGTLPATASSGFYPSGGAAITYTVSLPLTSFVMTLPRAQSAGAPSTLATAVRRWAD